MFLVSFLKFMLNKAVTATVSWPVKTSSSPNSPLIKLKLLFLAGLPCSSRMPLEMFRRGF